MSISSSRNKIKKLSDIAIACLPGGLSRIQRMSNLGIVNDIVSSESFKTMHNYRPQCHISARYIHFPPSYYTINKAYVMGKGLRFHYRTKKSIRRTMPRIPLSKKAGI